MRFRPLPPDPASPPLSVTAPWRVAAIVGFVLAVLFTLGTLGLGGRGAGVLVGFVIVLTAGSAGGRVVAWEEARRWRRSARHGGGS